MDSLGRPITLPGRTKHEKRAIQMEVLWRAFEKHEREQGKTVNGRGGRFLQDMSSYLHEPEEKLHQKVERMCKHADGLFGVFETA